MRETVLIIDDEKDILRLIEYNLMEEGYQIITAQTGEEGLKAVHENHPNLVILDLMLPDMDGRDILKKMRKKHETSDIPVLVLSAKSSEVDRVIAFELGCDDYLVKPFNYRELVLRVMSILRRMNPPETMSMSENIRIGDLVVDTARHRVHLEGQPEDRQPQLTPTEFKLLVHLVRRKDRVQTRESLLRNVWNVEPPPPDEKRSEGKDPLRTVDTHIRRLRDKMGTMDYTIKTVRKVGYIFKPPITGLVGGPGYKFEEPTSSD